MAKKYAEDYLEKNFRLNNEMHDAEDVAKAEADPDKAAEAWRHAANKAEDYALGLRKYAKFLRGLPQPQAKAEFSLYWAHKTEEDAASWLREAEEWREKAVTLTNRKSNGG